MEEIEILDLKIAMLSYVYRDIEKKARNMEKIYNFPKFSFVSYPNTSFIYRGKKVNVSLKTGRSRAFNNYGIELIQLIKGEENLYKEFLDQGREGLHHYDILVDDLDKYLRYFKKRGIEVIQSGKSLRKWAYLDTEMTFGIIIELVEIGKGKIIKE
ncbi:MAG: VOC family protein [Candidatus Hodarchaeota archaeon]